MASNSNCYKQQLNTNITSAKCVEELIPLLPWMPLNHLKAVMLQHIHSIYDAKTIFFYASSIDEILPSDIIGHILSFQSVSDLYSSRRINKQWYRLSNDSERKYFINLQQQLDQECPWPTKYKYDYKSNNTWIVHKSRFTPTPIESEMGFKEMFSNISYALSEAKPGDRIFVHKGAHVLSGETDLTDYISIIGLDESTKLCVQSSTGTLIVGRWRDLYIQNLVFDYTFPGTYPRSSIISVSGKLWANRCSFYTNHNGIQVIGNGSAVLNKCYFLESTQAIVLKASAKELKVLGCVFKYCMSAIAIHSSSKNVASLVCDGNIFTDVFDAPIYEKNKGKVGAYGECIHLYSLRNNVINDTTGKETIFNGNLIYNRLNKPINAYQLPIAIYDSVEW